MIDLSFNLTILLAVIPEKGLAAIPFIDNSIQTANENHITSKHDWTNRSEKNRLRCNVIYELKNNNNNINNNINNNNN